MDAWAPPVSPGVLAERLGALEVQVEQARAVVVGVHLPGYPGEVRPSGRLYLSGRGETAMAEHVGFEFAVQEHFAEGLARCLRGRRGAVASVVDPAAPPHTRAALEAALVELALRQGGLGLGELVGVSEATLDYVVSFEAYADPAARVRAARSRTPLLRFKVDATATWREEAVEALVATDAVDILDLKGRGPRVFAETLAARFPGAILEDPPLDAALPRRRVALDRSVIDEGAAARAAAAGYAVNVKPARMGGLLAALRGLEHCRSASARAYIGGMYEVGAARRQARVLAALFTPRAPNDLGPLGEDDPVERVTSMTPDGAHAPTLRLHLDRKGFG